jgi:N-acetylglucosaminyldiphosphoundecaprenol N-acetyl-beta-D-mannosaminyltransferase
MQRNRSRIVEILGVRIHDLTVAEILENIAMLATQESFHMVFTPNVDDIVKAQKDREFKEILNSATFNIPDGMGVVYGSYFLGTPFREMIGGRRLLPKICEWAIERDWRIYLFGSKNGVAALAKRFLEDRFPGVSIVGAHSPSMNIMNDSDENDGVVQSINSTKPDILFVGLGSPKGKRWIIRNKDKLQVSVAIEVGGALDILGGARKEPPLWVTEIGLEWLYRLFERPQYVWRRYLVDDPKFFWWVLRGRFKRHEK